MSSYLFGRATAVAVLSVTCYACANSTPSAVGKCLEDCQNHDAPSQSPSDTLDAAASDTTSTDAASTGTTTSNEATLQGPEAGSAVTDAGELSELEQELAAVDERMDYGYDDDPVLNELSRAAGHAGVAVCLCVLGDADTNFLAGCALDEAAVQFSQLPIDYADAMQCVLEQVGGAALTAYAACATELLKKQQSCYAERRGSGECVGCVQNFRSCPHSETIAATKETCSPFVAETPPRSRRILSPSEAP